jgi:hypothetical protein
MTFYRATICFNVLPATLLAIGLSACGSSSPDCSGSSVSVGYSNSQPSIVVTDSDTGAPICDAIIQIEGGHADPGASGPAVTMPSTDVLEPWAYLEVGPHIPINELGRLPGCAYGDASGMTFAGSYTLLVTKHGYQSAQVSNVLVVAAPLGSCNQPLGAAPAPQKVDVMLTPIAP